MCRRRVLKSEYFTDENLTTSHIRIHEQKGGKYLKDAPCFVYIIK
jgi:hypothetical protein